MTRPVPWEFAVSRPEVRALLARIGDGTHPTDEVYEHYVTMKQERGEAPAAKAALGRALSAAGQRPTRRRLDGYSRAHRIIRRAGMSDRDHL